MSAHPTRSGVPDPGLKLTYDDFLLFPDDGKRHELIDGEHYVTPSPNVRHQEILGRLHLLIGTWLQGHRVGKIFVAPLDVLFSRFDVVEPDLLYVSNERAAEVLSVQHGRCVDDGAAPRSRDASRARIPRLRRSQKRLRDEPLGDWRHDTRSVPRHRS